MVPVFFQRFPRNPFSFLLILLFGPPVENYLYHSWNTKQSQRCKRSDHHDAYYFPHRIHCVVSLSGYVLSNDRVLFLLESIGLPDVLIPFVGI